MVVQKVIFVHDNGRLKDFEVVWTYGTCGM